MPEEAVRRVRQGPATSGTVESVHDDLDGMWAEADFVPEADRMAFTLAVVEAAANVVTHAVPAADAPVELKVELVAGPCRLEARVYELNAAPAEVDLAAGAGAGVHEESGRGLSLIQALVSTVVFERHGNDNVWVLRRDSSGSAS